MGLSVSLSLSVCLSVCLSIGRATTIYTQVEGMEVRCFSHSWGVMLICKHRCYHHSVVLPVYEWLSGLHCSDKSVDRVCTHVRCVWVKWGEGGSQGQLSLVNHSAPSLVSWTHGRVPAICTVQTHKVFFLFSLWVQTCMIPCKHARSLSAYMCRHSFV